MLTKRNLAAMGLLASGPLVGWLATSLGRPGSLRAQDIPSGQSSGASRVLPVPDAPFAVSSERRPRNPNRISPLYNTATDFSQSKDLARQYPDKLRDMQALFLTEARKYNVLPLDSSFAERGDPTKRPNPIRNITDFTYYPGMIRIPENNSPNIKNRSFHVAADVEIPHGGAEGVLATQGGRFAGWALLVLDDKPEFVYAYSNQDGALYPYQRNDKTRITGSETCPGQAHYRFRFHLRWRRHRQGGHSDDYSGW